MEIPILGQRAAKSERVEICRSFAYKLNLANHGGPQYESVDLFSSRKMECAAEDAEWVSQQIFEECVEEVRSGVVAIKAKLKLRGAEAA